MRLKKLGNTSLETAPIVIGANVFGWTVDEETSFDILDRVMDLGFNTIDTADMYSRWASGNEGGESETIIGKWMKSRHNRDQVNIITKVGSDVGQGQKDISEAYILQAVEKSLKRLQVDHIDLYLTHFDDDRTPVEETMGAYDKLVTQGKVRYVGASNLSPARLQASLDASAQHHFPRYQVFQPEYNLYNRKGFENGVSQICQRENIGVISYFSLASGFLTGKYRSKADFGKSVRGGSMGKYLDERGLRILKALDEISEKYETSQAAVALAWLIHSPLVTAPIASASKVSHLEAFHAAATLKLTIADIEQLNRAST